MRDQIIALSGLLQACALVDEIAQNGVCDSDSLETCLESLLVTDPEDTLAVFGELTNLQVGLKLCTSLTGKNDDVRQANWVRYALTILHLQPKLSQNDAMMGRISQGIEQAKTSKAHFGTLHETTILNLANTYQETVSTFKTRIQVNGKPHTLQAPQNAAKIRALLLSGMRAAILWKQVGGHRWHFLFKRRQMLDTAEALLDRL